MRCYGAPDSDIVMLHSEEPFFAKVLVVFRLISNGDELALVEYLEEVEVGNLSNVFQVPHLYLAGNIGLIPIDGIDGIVNLKPATVRKKNINYFAEVVQEQ